MSIGPNFSSLPTELISSIFHDFLETHRDISALDIACAPSVRAAFLTALGNAQFAIQDSFHSPIDKKLVCYRKWLFARGVHLRRIEIHWSANNAVQWCTHFTEAFLHKIHHISFIENSYLSEKANEVVAFNFFAKCPQLTSVHLCSRYGQNLVPIVKQLLEFPTLLLSSFRCDVSPQAGTDWSDTRIQVLNAFHRTLADLALEKISQSDLVHIQACHLLKSLSIFPHQSLFVESIEFFDSFPDLEELTLLHLPPLCFVKLSKHLPRLRKFTLHGLAFPHVLVSTMTTTVKNILRFFPALHLLEIHEFVRYRNISTATISGCSVCMLKWFHRGADLKEILEAILPACPVPVLEFSLAKPNMFDMVHVNTFAWDRAPVDVSLVWRTVADLIGPTLRTIPSEIEVDESWTDDDFEHIFSCIGGIKTLKLKEGFNTKVYNITDRRIVIIAQYCQQISELSIDGSLAVTSVGLLALLTSCGFSLSTLSLIYCKKITGEALDVLVEHCPRLQVLSILETGIKVGDIVEKILLPRHLNELHKLTVGKQAFSTIMKMNEIPSHRKYIFRSSSTKKGK